MWLRRLWVFLLLFTLARSRNIRVKGNLKSPIILVPGDGGSQIFAKINKTWVPHYLCRKTSADFFDLWLNIEELAPLVIDCFVENMRLVYDVSKRRTFNSPGVEILIPGWGNTSTVEWLDPSQLSVSAYFSGITAAAVSWGYTRGKDIRGAPYDFRKAPNEQADFFTNIQSLIEATYYDNGNEPVTVIAHSLGNNYMLFFYHKQSQAWKDKFIRAHVSIGAPWGGSAKILKLFASGYNMDHWRLLLDPLKIRPEQRSMVSSAFLLPSPKFWNSTEVLVETDTFNYTTADYTRFFRDMKFPIGALMREDTEDLVDPEVPPGVEVHCLCGTKTETPEKFLYAPKSFPDSQPTEMFGDGDGTVGLRSLQGCLRWKGRQKQPIAYRELAGREHLSMLQDVEVISHIKAVVMPKRRQQAKAARIWASLVKQLRRRLTADATTP